MTGRATISGSHWYYLFVVVVVVVDLRERKGEGERERKEGRNKQTDKSICCPIYLCILWLLLVCALTKDQIYNIGISG